MTNDITSQTYSAVFASLLGLLGLTVAAAHFDLGALNVVVALVIAAAKATLVLLYFMQLKRSNHLVQVYSWVGLAWLLIAFVLTMADYLTRTAVNLPG